MSRISGRLLYVGSFSYFRKSTISGRYMNERILVHRPIKTNSCLALGKLKVSTALQLAVALRLGQGEHFAAATTDVNRGLKGGSVV